MFRMKLYETKLKKKWGRTLFMQISRHKYRFLQL